MSSQRKEEEGFSAEERGKKGGACRSLVPVKVVHRGVRDVHGEAQPRADVQDKAGS